MPGVWQLGELVESRARQAAREGPLRRAFAAQMDEGLCGLDVGLPAGQVQTINRRLSSQARPVALRGLRCLRVNMQP